MAHIAIAITGLSGILHSSFEMVSKLEAEGHQVTYLCPLDIGERVERLGFTFVKIPEINFRLSGMDYKEENPSWLTKAKYHFKNNRTNYEKGKELLNLNEYRAIMKSLHPEFVLGEIEMHELILTALSLKIPVTLFSQWFPDSSTTLLPSIRSTIIPGKGLSGTTIGILSTRAYLRLRFRTKLLIDNLNFNNYRRIFLKKYAKEVGLDVNELYLNNFPPLFTFRKLPIVGVVMKDLDFFHRPDKNFSYAWPMVYIARDGKGIAPQSTSRIDDVLTLKKELSKKLIYCSLGTFVKADTTFLKKVIKAFENEPNWILILSSKNEIFEQGTEPKAENVFLFKTVPQLRVLQYADCCINHGGINTIHECIHFSVPMLIYSAKKYDQNGCSARVAFHGLGISSDKDKDDIETIRQNIYRVLNEEKYRNKIAEYNTIYLQNREKKLSPVLGIK